MTTERDSLRQQVKTLEEELKENETTVNNLKQRLTELEEYCQSQVQEIRYIVSHIIEY